MLNIFGELKKLISRIGWYFKYDRPLRKQLAYLDEAIDIEAAGYTTAAALEPCVTIEAFEQALENKKDRIIVKNEAYKVWKPYVKSVFKRRKLQTIVIGRKWRATFGAGDDIVIMTRAKRRRLGGIYKIRLVASDELIVFDRVK